MGDDRAVSEVVGFILVFALVLGTISMVYVGGLGGLQDARDNEQNTNAERAFDVLATNVEEVATGKAPSRATEVKLSDAQLTVGERREVSVAIDGVPVLEPRPRPIIHDSGGGTKIVYEMGAVIRVDGDSARMLRQPDYVFSDDVAVIRHIDTSGGAQSVSGSTTVLVRTVGSTVRQTQEDVDDVVTYSVNTTHARAPVWQEYLDGQESVTCDAPVQVDGELSMVECEIDVDRFSVTRLFVNVELT